MKSRVEDLAIFGGSPAFPTELHVGRPNIGNRQQLFRRINDILERRWLTNDGPCVKEFEQRICQLIGVKHCVAICNATVALEITAKALGLSGEVIVPSFTFVATAHALQWLGITPVFCDIDPATHNLDPARVAELITDRTSAIMGVHVWGRPCDIDALVDLAQRYRLKLLFDAAHAFGCSYKGRMIGSFGNAEIFSFHATKFVNAFEGGAVVTDDDELALRLRLIRNFGFAGYDTVTCLGTNGKMNEVSAAFGLTNLESIKEFTEANQRNFDLYRTHLTGVKGLGLVEFDEEAKPNYQYVVCQIDPATAGISRDQLVDLLHAENILARKYFYPGVHRMEPYRSNQRNVRLALSNTERVADQVMVLPTGTAIARSDVEKICGILRFAITNGESIGHAMTKRNVNRG
jgi:dTDP-4-amino-4,6-dideoxygalactose transaminase